MENNYNNFQEENFLSGKDKKNSFVLPEGYFNSLSTRVLNRIEHEKELREFKILTANRQLKFAVPQNYFSSLTNILEYKYELSVYPELNKVAKPANMPLPAGYFETLNKKLMDKLEMESELKEFSVLSSIEKKNNFKVVPDYFESKTDSYEEKIHSEKNQRGIVRQLFATIIKPQMAIAASLVLIIGISAIWYFNRKDTTILNSDCQTLACLEKNEILNEKNIQDFDDESLYEMVDVEMLDKQMSGGTKNGDSLNTNKE